MSSKHLVFVTAINLIWFILPAAAQEKTDRDKQTKRVAEKFAREFIFAKDAVKATKLTAVPFVEIVQGREDKPMVIQKSADVEKRIRAVIKNQEKLGIRGKVTIEKVYDAPEDEISVILDKIPKEVFNKKTDRVILIDLDQDSGFPFGLVTLVSWRKEQPKVIGYGLYFSI